jgi:hypothetical protein
MRSCRSGGAPTGAGGVSTGGPEGSTEGSMADSGSAGSGSATPGVRSRGGAFGGGTSGRTSGRILVATPPGDSLEGVGGADDEPRRTKKRVPPRSRTTPTTAIAIQRTIIRGGGYRRTAGLPLISLSGQTGSTTGSSTSESSTRRCRFTFWLTTLDDPPGLIVTP